MGITNTMEKEILSARELLKGTGISILDAARFIRNALDVKPKSVSISDAEFCTKIIDAGKAHICMAEIDLAKAFALHLESKSHLRPESRRDIRYLGRRLLNSAPGMRCRNLSEISPEECEQWLAQAFRTPSQFNKGRAMLHSLFQFAVRRRWCRQNPVSLVERRKVLEKEIRPLTPEQTRRLIQTAIEKHRDCAAAVAILVLAGLRPGEVTRLGWSDIDLKEESITVRSICSKTGGIRHVEICPALKFLLVALKPKCGSRICPGNWTAKWRRIRREAGFGSAWVQDVLRHTYASYHAKRFRDLGRLQLNMGHSDQSLLRYRYVNMYGVTNSKAREFFTPKARVENRFPEAFGSFCAYSPPSRPASSSEAFSQSA